MYKYLLGWRYLRTRWIALASIISVTLGVATMIVVNSVMAGFTHEMMARMHGILADVIFEGHGLNGFPDAEYHMAQIRRVAGDYIEGMTPVVTVPAMLTYEFRGHQFNRQILLIGIDENTHASVSDFAKYLQHPANRKRLTFNLHESGYDVIDHQSPDNAVPRPDMEHAGWEYRRVWGARKFERQKAIERLRQADEAARASIEPPATNDSPSNVSSDGVAGARPSEQIATNPFEARRPPRDEQLFDESKDQHVGIIIGKGLISAYRADEQMDRFLSIPGDDVQVTVPTAGTPPKGVSKTFTVVDVYESKMSEYDSQFVFVPIRELQNLRGMIEPSTGVGHVTSIQIKLKNEADGQLVRDKLRAAFKGELYGVYTWQDKQGSLLTAVALEKSILNILLFLIITVAGFGILAIFYMIVVEKTRDIGILKSLGASRGGIMGIFLGYGLSLGTVGAGAGLALGLMFVAYINEVRDVLEWITGTKVFDPSIYYFFKIPTIVEPFTVGWIVIGSIAIAVLASVLPARRAARLHPVEALRYE
jgi:lipoprotein-releasing system permease protein